MPHSDTKKSWDEYRELELKRLTPLLTALGFELGGEQMHLSGERYLMSGRKLVLIGERTRDALKSIIKASSDPEGRREIAHEHALRELLPRLPFAYHTFPAPIELAYRTENGMTIAVTQFIAEDKGFLEHTLREQFSLALAAFKLQEGVHAVSYGHTRTVRKAFGMTSVNEYLHAFSTFEKSIHAADPSNTELLTMLAQAETFLTDHRLTLEQYNGFLTHTDFVPHNVRVSGGTLYLLDHTSLRFGNKYESWARFLNYMVLYGPELEQALLAYVRENRTPEEYLSLRLMRVYKLAFLLDFYAESLAKTEGDLHTLAQLRVRFWTQVLADILQDRAVSEDAVRAYKTARDALRSTEELARQRGLKQLR